MSHSRKSARHVSSSIISRGQLTYTDHKAVFDQSWEFPSACAAHPQSFRFLVGGGVDVHEGDAIGSQDCFYARGGSDDMRAAGGQGGVEVEARVLL
jgi:hypothetical protein